MFSKYQLQRSPQRAVRASNVAEGVLAVSEPQFVSNGAIDDDQRRRKVRGGLHAVHVEAFIAHRPNQRQQYPHHLWNAARHHRVCSDLLDRGFPIAGRHAGNYFGPVHRCPLEHARDALRRRRNHRQCVAKSSEAILEWIFAVRDFDHRGRKAARGADGGGGANSPSTFGSRCRDMQPGLLCGVPSNSSATGAQCIWTAISFSTDLSNPKCDRRTRPLGPIRNSEGTNVRSKRREVPSRNLAAPERRSLVAA